MVEGNPADSCGSPARRGESEDASTAAKGGAGLTPKRLGDKAVSALWADISQGTCEISGLGSMSRRANG